MRKIKMIDGNVLSFYIKGEKNPCGCGSNCFHKEDDGETMFGVCSACKQDIYKYKGRDTSGEWGNL